MAETTTIKIRKTTKQALDRYREHPAESYDHVIRKMAKITEDLRTEPELSRETLRQLDESRERFARGEYLTHEELCKRLGLDVPPHLRQHSTASTPRVAESRPAAYHKKNSRKR